MQEIPFKILLNWIRHWCAFLNSRPAENSRTRPRIGFFFHTIEKSTDFSDKGVVWNHRHVLEFSELSNPALPVTKRVHMKHLSSFHSEGTNKFSFEHLAPPPWIWNAFVICACVHWIWTAMNSSIRKTFKRSQRADTGREINPFLRLGSERKWRQMQNTLIEEKSNRFQRLGGSFTALLSYHSYRGYFKASNCGNSALFLTSLDECFGLSLLQPLAVRSNSARSNVSPGWPGQVGWNMPI